MYFDFLKEAKKLRGRMAEDRRYLHKNAEVGFELPVTLAFVERRLTELGYRPRPCGKCGILADVGDGDTCTVLRADMDSLPIREETGLDFACEGGNMHACGHDMHTAMLLGAARLLKLCEEELTSRVRLMFQPAEEIFGGARDMILGGALKNAVSALAIHVAPSLPYPCGSAVLPPAGLGAPSTDLFRITVRGKGCHSSTPGLGADAAVAAAHLVAGLHSVLSRELPVSGGATLTVGRLLGGYAPNAVAELVTLEGSLRAADGGMRERLLKRISSAAESIPSAFGAIGEAVIIGECPALINGEAAVLRARRAAERILEPSQIITLRENEIRSGLGGSEDFAYVCREIPGTVLLLGAGEKENGYSHPLHSPRVLFDEDALPFGAALYAAFAVDGQSVQRDGEPAP